MERAWFQRLKLIYDRLLSSFAFNFNLRRYNKYVDVTALGWGGCTVAVVAVKVDPSLTPT